MLSATNRLFNGEIRFAHFLRTGKVEQYGSKFSRLKQGNLMNFMTTDRYSTQKVARRRRIYSYFLKLLSGFDFECL